MLGSAYQSVDLQTAIDDINCLGSGHHSFTHTLTQRPILVAASNPPVFDLFQGLPVHFLIITVLERFLHLVNSLGEMGRDVSG